MESLSACLFKGDAFWNSLGAAIAALAFDSEGCVTENVGLRSGGIFRLDMPEYWVLSFSPSRVKIVSVMLNEFITNWEKSGLVETWQEIAFARGVFSQITSTVI